MRIGILGGGQLARMLALAGYPLGQEFVFLDPQPDACAGQVGRLICAPFDDERALEEFTAAADLVTLDFENVPLAAARRVAEQRPLRPGPGALEVAQDRLREKTLFTDLGIPCPLYATVESHRELIARAEEIGFPCVLKTRRMGYDGKGQAIIRDRASLDQAWERLGGVPLVLEELVRFKRELSILALRSARGEIAYYPLTENRHKKGILISSFAPASAAGVEDAARRHARRIIEALDYCGLLAVEFFDRGDVLLANEIAPRVHNSGHWTIDGAVTSQFENHLRAIMGWPLGSTEAIGASAMLNWIGAMPDPSSALSYPNARWHDYGKKPRAGRKVGHVTINGGDMISLQAELARFAQALGEQLQANGIDTFTQRG